MRKYFVILAFVVILIIVAVMVAVAQTNPTQSATFQKTIFWQDEDATSKKGIMYFGEDITTTLEADVRLTQGGTVYYANHYSYSIVPTHTISITEDYNFPGLAAGDYNEESRLYWHIRSDYYLFDENGKAYLDNTGQRIKEIYFYIKPEGVSVPSSDNYYFNKTVVVSEPKIMFFPVTSRDK